LTEGEMSGKRPSISCFWCLALEATPDAFGGRGCPSSLETRDSRRRVVVSRKHPRGRDWPGWSKIETVGGHGEETPSISRFERGRGGGLRDKPSVLKN